MPDDPNPTSGEPGSEENKRTKNVTCEFCDCTLYADGSIKKKSDKARRLDTHQDVIDRTAEERDKALERCGELEKELETEKKKTSTPNHSADDHHDDPPKKKPFAFVL